MKTTLAILALALFGSASAHADGSGPLRTWTCNFQATQPELTALLEQVDQQLVDLRKLALDSSYPARVRVRMLLARADGIAAWSRRVKEPKYQVPRLVAPRISKELESFSRALVASLAPASRTDGKAALRQTAREIGDARDRLHQNACL